MGDVFGFGTACRDALRSRKAMSLTMPSLEAKQPFMAQRLSLLAILAGPALLALALGSCASRGEIEADRVAKEDAFKAEDDAACRAANTKPDTPEYNACRQERATARARKAQIDYQKARDFDRVLGGLDQL